MTVVLVARDPWVGLAGLAFVGIGFANVIPILFIGASRVPGVAPAHGIAALLAFGSRTHCVVLRTHTIELQRVKSMSDSHGLKSRAVCSC